MTENNGEATGLDTATLPESVVSAEGIVKRFGTLEVVQRVTFDIRPKECFGFLGPNGAGKTTMVNLLTSRSPITAGSIHVFGLDIEKHYRKIKEKIGIVPQEENLDPDLTVLENLVLYAGYFGVSRKKAKGRAAELLGFMQLTEKKDAKISSLSGGMKRRLLIARSMINQPKLVVLDEPTIGLDPQARHLVWNKLRALKEEGGVTMLLTTHYMEEAARLCDRLIIMDEGRIVAEGTPGALIDKHIGPQVVEIHDGSTSAVELEEIIQGLDVTIERVGNLQLLFTRDGKSLIRRLSGVASGRFLLRPATLEDVFFRLTGRELRE